MENPNVDPSVRENVPQVKDLKEKFREILHEELSEATMDGFDISTEIDKAVDRLMDAVTNTLVLDPH